MAKHRTETVEFNSRISVVYRLLLNGLRRREIIQYASEKTDWNVSDRSIDEYIRRAREEIAEMNEEERKGAYGMARKRLDDLYFKSMKINDYKTCLSVQKEINLLEGLAAAAKVEVTGKDGGPVESVVIYIPENGRN